MERVVNSQNLGYENEKRVQMKDRRTVQGARRKEEGGSEWRTTI
jgi:hypothetical protein